MHLLLTSPSVRPHAQHYQLLAKKHFYLATKSKAASVPSSLLASSVNLPVLNYSKYGQLAYMHSTPTFPKVIGMIGIP